MQITRLGPVVLVCFHESVMKLASAYMRKDVVYFHSSSKTTEGVWILSSPCVAVDVPNARDMEVAMVAALNASREGVPHPTSWGGVFDPVLMLAGVKSWNAFCKSARLVNLELDGDRLRLIPSKNTGSKEGFVTLEGLTIIGSLSAGGLDKQLLRAFSSSV